jgi:hypothetical protein
MPWLKTGDNAATHPIVMKVASSGPRNVDELDSWELVNLVFGLIARCAIHSAAHLTDYFIDDGTVMMLGGPHANDWAELARKAGYWRRTSKNGGRGWLLVDDPDFLSIRLEAEVTWEKQQRADAANVSLTIPVRLRDGDACRYCAAVVQWAARKGSRRGTYDHRQPGEPATVDTLVVACGACNSARRDRPDADEQYPLRPAPQDPFYSPSTATLLQRHGHDVKASPSRTGTQLDTATPRDPQRTTRPRTADVGKSHDLQISADPSRNPAHATGRVGSGRVSTGQVGSPQARRKRARRGRPRTADPSQRRATP